MKSAVQEEEGVDYSSEEGNQENSSQSSKSKTSQEYAETVESFEVEEPVAGPSTTDTESLNGDTNGAVSSGTADSSFTDEISDDESICRSPAKSPVKKVGILPLWSIRGDPMKKYRMGFEGVPKKTCFSESHSYLWNDFHIFCHF